MTLSLLTFIDWFNWFVAYAAAAAALLNNVLMMVDICMELQWDIGAV